MKSPVNILFLCAGNSARSILAEALLSRDGDGRFRAFSAGTSPQGEVHPLLLELLATLGIPTRGLRSKGLQEFAGPGAAAMDAVIDICDEAGKRAAFLDAYLALHARISRLLDLPFPSLGHEELRSRLEEIDRTS